MRIVKNALFFISIAVLVVALMFTKNYMLNEGILAFKEEKYGRSKLSKTNSYTGK